MMFAVFKNELLEHPDGGYHHCDGPRDRKEVNAWFQERHLAPPQTYVDFLCEVGPGSYFGGALVIYPLSHKRLRSVESELTRIRKDTDKAIFPFGYNGTTELCYCFQAEAVNDVVYWFSWEEKTTRLLSNSFEAWLDEQPTKLFKHQIYAGYKRLRNVNELVEVMEERSFFKVRLVDFDIHLQRPPDKPNDMLRRYNRVVLEVTKTRPAKISVLTVIIARLGSPLGDRNVEYATFPVNDIPVGVPTKRECYVFDPYNVPFTDVALRFNPVIDLGSKMRVKFKEISDLLNQ